MFYVGGNFGVYVVKELEGAIVRRVHLFGDDGQPITAVSRFLGHLAERGYSPFTLAAYAYDLQNLFVFLASVGLEWQAFRPADAGLSATETDSTRSTAVGAGSDR